MEQSNKGHIIYNTYLSPGIKITSQFIKTYMEDLKLENL